MYPVRDVGEALPAAFGELVTVDTPLSFTPEEVRDNRDAWVAGVARGPQPLTSLVRDARALPGNCRAGGDPQRRRHRRDGVFAGHATGAALSDALTDPYVWRVAGFTVLQAALSMALAIVLAVPFARAAARRGDLLVVRAMLALASLAFVTPVIIGVFGVVPGAWPLGLGRRGGGPRRVLRPAAISTGFRAS